MAEIGEGQMKDRVSIDFKDGVADVRLIRAEKMNALDPAMFEGIIEAGDQLAKMKGLRAVVLSGEGKAFCAGLDMGSFAAMKQDGDAVPGVRDLTKRIMLGADMRYATADTRFSVMEIKWGLVPDLAGTQLMRHLAREDVVRELTYTGRIFNGTEAQQLGFVTRVVDDPRAAALETAKEIANKSPDAVRAAKRILNDAVAVDAAAGLMAESVEQQKLIGSPNQLEAIMSNLQKRAANYKD
jgi:enoyl-CoA hydratase/carnithine racemase